MVETIVGALFVAALVGLVAIFRGAAMARLEAWRPVAIVADRIVQAPWAVASANPELPDVSPLESADPMPRSTEVHDWLLDHDGIEHRESKLRLVVTGLSARTAVITDIRIKIERSAPVAGIYVHCPSAGANTATLLVFDLDSASPQGWEWIEHGGRERVGTSPYFDGHNISLAEGETHTLVLACTTTDSCCQWKVVLDVIVGRRRKAVVVTADDNGRALLTSGDPPGGFAQRFHWAWYEGGRFIREPPGI